MKFINFLCISLVFCSFSAFAIKKTPRFDCYNIKEGLPNEVITEIYQDRFGYIWIGTEDGLSRFDGYKFETYKRNEFDTNSIAGNIVRDMLEDQEGQLWIATNDGLSKFNRGTNNFTSYTKKDPKTKKYISSYIWKMVTLNDHELLLGFNSAGFDVFDTKIGKFIVHDLKKNHPALQLKSNRNDFFAKTKDNHLVLQVDSTANEYELPSYKLIRKYPINGGRDFSAFYKDQNIVMIGSSAGVMRLDLKTNETISIGYDASIEYTLSGGNIGHILKTKSNQFWLGSSTNGISVLNDLGKVEYMIKKSYSTKSGLQNGKINALFEDRTGIIWIGTYSGLYKYNPYHNAFEFYFPADNDTSKRNFNVNAIAEINQKLIFSSQSKIWVSTLQENIEPIQVQCPSFNTLKNGAFIKGKDGKIWLTVLKNELGYIDPQTLKYQVFKSKLLNDLSLYHVNAVGDMVFYNNKPFYYTKEFNRLDSLNCTDNLKYMCNNKLQSIYSDSKGNVWYLTRGFGVIVFDQLTKKFNQFIPSENNPDGLSDIIVQCMTEDKKGNFWFGTKTGGICYLNRSLGKFKTYQEQNGLLSNMVFSITEDATGRLWLGTSKGLSMFDPSTERFRNFGPEEGFPQEGFNNQAAYLASNGILYLGFRNGIIYFRPEEIVSDPYAPQVQITSLLIDNQKVIPGKSEFLSKSILETNEIELDYKHNGFTLEFSAFHFNNPSKNRFTYSLLGYDKKWYITDNERRFVTYSNLPPGTYEFKIKACNANGVWAKEEKTMIVTIKPAFWQTWWFRILASLCAFGIIYSLYKSRMNKARSSELEKLVDERTKELQTRNDQIIFQNEKIENLLQEYTDNARTALLIQNSILPSKEKMLELIPQHFILYLSKDIVSGDFYWLAKKNGKIYLAAVDCTGHGVAGGFMSMMAYSILNNVVNQENDLSPALLLNELNRQLVEMLTQKQNNQRDTDGMDMSIIEITPGSTTIRFAGAMNPIYVLRNNEIEKIAGEKSSIGLSRFRKEQLQFSDIEVEIQAGEQIYLFSDGYVAQMGGSDGNSKLMFQNFRSTLIACKDLPMNEQRARLESFLLDWKGKNEQTDDILVIGLKLP